MQFFKTNVNAETELTWRAGPGAEAMLDENAPAHLAGRLILNGKVAYLTLGPAPSSYSRLPSSYGIEVSTQQFHVFELDVEDQESVDWTLMVLEYDKSGARVGTVRYSKNGVFRYRSNENVSRILVAVRADGAGELRLSHIGWKVETDIFERALSASPQPEPPSFHSQYRKELHFDDNKPLAPFTIWPNGSVKISAFDLAPGLYEFDILHRDPVVAAKWSNIAAYISLDKPLEDGMYLPTQTTRQRDKGTLKFPVPVVSRREGRYRQAIQLALLDPQDWVVVELDLGMDRLINVDRATIRSVKPPSIAAPDGSLFAERVANYLKQVDDPESIENIVYADISLNVADGSSIWLSSVLSMLTRRGRCLLISKYDVASDIILSNVRHRERLEILQPSSVRHRKPFIPRDAIELLRRLDERLPNLRNVVVRGSAVTGELFKTRRFKERGFPYLTDFYEADEDGVTFPRAKIETVRRAATHAKALLVQNRQIEHVLQQIADRKFDKCLLPPAIPDDDPSEIFQAIPSQGRVRIGYAGKVNPRWGVTELLDWAERLKERGVDVELTIVSNKISESAGKLHVPGFRQNIRDRIEKLGALLLTDLNRQQSMAMMNAMDYVWCWRPSTLEDNTLELSTKLLEMVALDARCIAYPNAINCEVLGKTYPFFARDFDDFATIVNENRPAPDHLAKDIVQRFDLNRIGELLWQECLNAKPSKGKNILVAGHGLKFVEPYLSSLKARGHKVRVDQWEWGRPIKLAQSEESLEWADVILCEWGLANAAWYSQHLTPGKKLYVRCHAQEVRDKARRFAAEIDADRVEKFIFVSERIRRRAIELYGWPEEKTVMVPNYLLDDEYRLLSQTRDDTIRLGLVGMIPESKRIDRAFDVLEALIERGENARLFVKGHRPEQMPHMFAPGRIEEMKFYARQYGRLEQNPHLKSRVVFEGWGNDVADWYGHIDYILSPSDHESFHYALADGVLAGCYPLVWPWEDAERVYPPEWIIEDAQAAAERIVADRNLGISDHEEQRHARRKWLVDRYGFRKIFYELDEVLGLTRGPTRTGS